MNELNKLIQPYVQKLGLRWPINWVTQQVVAVSSALASISSREGSHQIQCDQPAVEKLWSGAGGYNLLFGSILHELCHAYLAERIDPIFSGAKFPARWAAVSRKQNKKLARKQQLFLSFDGRLVDVWVNDVFQSTWPGLFETHKYRYGSRLAQARTSPYGSLALYLAEARRHRLPHVDVSGFRPRAVYAADELWTEEKMVAFSRHLETLPKLLFRREDDLGAYEKANRQAAALLGFPIQPRLVKEGKQWVWEL